MLSFIATLVCAVSMLLSVSVQADAYGRGPSVSAPQSDDASDRGDSS